MSFVWYEGAGIWGGRHCVSGNVPVSLRPLLQPLNDLMGKVLAPFYNWGIEVPRS